MGLRQPGADLGDLGEDLPPPAANVPNYPERRRRGRTRSGRAAAPCDLHSLRIYRPKKGTPRWRLPKINSVRDRRARLPESSALGKTARLADARALDTEAGGALKVDEQHA